MSVVMGAVYIGTTGVMIGQTVLIIMLMRRTVSNQPYFSKFFALCKLCPKHSNILRMFLVKQSILLKLSLRMALT